MRKEKGKPPFAAMCRKDIIGEQPLAATARNAINEHSRITIKF